MAEPKIKIEFLNPTNIRSEVPHEQPLRNSDDSVSNMADETNMAENGAKNDNSSFVPVFMSRKEEAHFTKGDTKLQKVSVTENISVGFQYLFKKQELPGKTVVTQKTEPERHKEANPIYSEVLGEVIDDPRPPRPAPRNKNTDEGLTINGSDDNSYQDEQEPRRSESKKRTKIPTMRLKQAAEMVKEDRRGSGDNGEVPSNQPRRSSIPRRRRKSYKSPPPPDKTKEDTAHEQEDNTALTNQPEDLTSDIDKEETEAMEEFDKIYDEILHTDESLPFIDSNIQLLPNVDNLEDPVSLEHSFEEMVHDYEENKVKPIDVKDIKSRIPLVRQKSLPEDKFSKKLERRLSLKDVSLEDSKKKENAKKHSRSKLDDIKKKYDKQQKEDLKEHKRLTKEILKREDEQYKDKQHKIKSKFLPGKNPLDNNNKKITTKSNESPVDPKTVNKETRQRAKKTNDPVEETNQLLSQDKSPAIIDEIKLNKEKLNESVKTTKQDNLKLENNSYEQPESSKLVQIITNQTAAKYHEIKMSDGSPLLIENTLPAQKRHPKPDKRLEKDLEVQKKLDNEALLTNSTLIKEKDINEQPHARENNKQEDKLIPISQSKVSKLANKFTANDPSFQFLPRKEINEEIPKKKSIISKIALFNKDDSTKEVSKNNATEKTEINNNLTSKPNENESFQLNEIEESLDKTTTKINIVNEPHLYHHTKDDSAIKTSNIEVEEASNFRRSESVPIGISNNKHKLHPETPPNTPSVSRALEPTKYSKYVETFNRIEEASEKLTFENGKPKEDKDKNVIISQNNFETSKISEDHEELSKSRKERAFRNSEDFNLVADVCNEFKENQKVNIEGLTPDIIERKLSFEAINTETYEGDFILKGNVTKIITRLVSTEDKTSQPKKENIIDVPIKKSVSSRISMFERQAPSVPQKTFNFKTEKKENTAHAKPRIIKELLKPIPPKTLDGKENKIQVTDITSNTEISKEIDPKTKSINETFGTENQEVDKHKISEELPTEKILKADSLEPNKASRKIRKSIEDIIPKSPREILAEKIENDNVKLEKDRLASKIEERLKRIQSIDNEGSLQKVKPIADNDLGHAVRGKVHQILNRIQSMERLDVDDKKEISREEKDKIIERERPRKKSVSEKIALFEKKITAVDITPTSTPVISTKGLTTVTFPSPLSKDSKMSSTDYQERIKLLKMAKETYGVTEMQYMELNNGVEIPVLALGTALLDAVLLPHIISAAIELGYRAFDTAFIYGNEKQVGEAIRAKIDDGTVRREDLFISGKLWSTFHRRNLVEDNCRMSLQNLGLEYFDLYMVHNPMSLKEGNGSLPMIAGVLQYSEDADYLDAWYGLENIYYKGLVKSIGVSNFNSEQIARVVEKGKIRPVVNQVECHPYLNQERLDDFCAQRNITLYCYGTLGSIGTPKELKAHSAPVLKDPLIVQLAEKLNVTPAQLLIRFQLENGHPVVTKCSSASHLWDNLQAQYVNLTEEDMQTLRKLNRNKRTYVFKGMGDTHRNYPFKIPF